MVDAGEGSATPPRAVDPRIAAAVQVLAGQDLAAVAEHHGVEPALVRRWATQFLAAGAAAVRGEALGGEAEARDRLLAAIEHELRTPLALLRGYAGLLAAGRVEADQQVELAARVEDRVRALEDVLVRLGETTAATLGRLRLRREPTTLAALLEPFSRRCRVQVEADAELEVDIVRVRLVVGDLLDVAHAAHGTTDVVLRARAGADWHVLEVRRSGAPMDPERLRVLLDPFAPRDGHADVTFGLYLARALVVRHGGQLGVRREDDGTDRLWVRLPPEAPEPGPGDGVVVPLRPEG